jgi:inner membrane protein
MPTVMSHAVVGLALGTLSSFPRRHRTFWLASAALPVLPDLDVFGRAFGIAFYSMWGHRGMSHSFVGAAVIGLIADTPRPTSVPTTPAPSPTSVTSGAGD